jgi:membrane protease YdiL (CAAX protease family)
MRKFSLAFMNITPAIATTYGLLAAALISAWLKPIRINQSITLPPWVAVFATACLSGLITGLVIWQGVLALAAFAALAYATTLYKVGIIKAAMLVVTGWMTLSLSVHRFPGFVNPSLVSNMRFPNGQAFTHNLNFDTSAAGLILFALFCLPARTRQEWREVARQYPVILGTPVVVLLIGCFLGYVNVDPKIVAYTPIFFICNLLFTCIIEEAFFRGFIQAQLTVAMQRWRAGQYIALVVAAILFGIAHAKGGPMLVGLAALAGIGYGYAFLRSKRIEAAILTHFALNALHFVAFTYPRAL